MATILILSNSVGGLCSFRYELFDRLVKLGHEVWFAVPQDEEHRKVRLLRELGAKYIHTEFARRAVEPFGERRLIRRYIDIIGELNPDVILTYTIKPNIYGTYAAHKKKHPCNNECYWVRLSIPYVQVPVVRKSVVQICL